MASTNRDPSEQLTALSIADRESTAWFEEHYVGAADQILEFLGGDGITLQDRDVCDVGCGDGIISLGVATKGRPRTLVGYDVVSTDVGHLLELARREGIADELPQALSFEKSGPVAIPAEDESFDIVYSWSAFEHIEDPVAMCSEVRRVLRRDAVFMLQIWPLYYSEHGAHLWQCIPEGFSHLLHPESEIEETVRANPTFPIEIQEEFLEVYRTLNKLTIEDLQRAVTAGGMRATKVELLTHPVHIPRSLARRSLCHLAIAGVKLIAVRDR